jgi:prevent-host-death family protein
VAADCIRHADFKMKQRFDSGRDDSVERNRDFQSRFLSFLRLAHRPNPVYTNLMAATYNMKEAQASLTKLCRSGERFVIANRNEPVVVALPVEDFEALMETLDVLGNPAAMEAIQAAKQGKTHYRPLDLNDENFGL